MKRLFTLAIILFSFTSQAQLSIGFEGGVALNFFQPQSVAETMEPTFGVQTLLFNNVSASYSTRNVLSVGVLPLRGGYLGRSGCGYRYQNDFTWGLEVSYSFQQERGGGGLMFGYTFRGFHTLTMKLNTLDGVRIGYMVNL